jgi:hypothetical protein
LAQKNGYPDFGIELAFYSGKERKFMNKTKLITILSLTTALTGATIYLLKQCRHKKRMAVISDAGYETAYDIHFPLKYKR